MKTFGSSLRKRLELFNNKRRLDSAWAKGLMFGKAVGARDERERIIALIESLDTELTVKGENGVTYDLAENLINEIRVTTNGQ